MKKSQVLLVAVMGITALFGGCSTADDATPAVNQAQAKAKGPSANGQGGLLIGGQVQNFSFQASTDANGVTTGSFETKSPSQDLRLHGNITCLTILPDGKTAFMSGVITQRVGDGFPGNYLIGNNVYFEVQDNGEGANALNDMFSDVQDSGVNSFCGPYTIGLQNITNGNFKVKP